MVPSRHIVFVGAMGSGKSTIGRRVAATLARPFVDNDELLEAKVGLTAAEVEARDGIDALHRLEAQLLLDALERDVAAVITAAASTIDDSGVRSALRAPWVVWLRADPATLAARLPGCASRPFRDHDPAQLVLDQAARRDPRFAEVADATFETDSLDIDTVAANVAAAYL